jgi:hypothetical protein
MPIHANFPDWYRAAAVTPPDGLLEKRWAAVEAVAKEAKADLLVGLVRLFVIQTGEAYVPAGFREAIKARDEGFSSKGDVQELRVLAGAVLRLVMESDTYPLTAALAMVCAAFGPRRAKLPEPDHLEFAERFLVEIGKALRATEALPPLKVSSFTKKKLSEALPANLFHPNQTPNLHEPLTTLLTEMAAALVSAKSALDQLANTSAIQSEELNALWWLQTSFSRIIQKPFSEIDKNAAPIILASELAELTAFPPGLESSTAMLVHALFTAGSTMRDGVTIANAVNSTPRAWREKIRTERILDRTGAVSPLSLALDKSLDTDDPRDWLPVYTKVCDIPLDTPFDGIQIATQLYRELMLWRVVSKQPQ